VPLDNRPARLPCVMAPTSHLSPAFLSRLEALRLSIRQVRWGSRLGGRFLISRRGSSIEFADYAAYAPGDDIRAIDWNLYARLDRLFVKTYKEEIELAVEVLVDATASMGLPSMRKFERAVELSLALGYVGLAGHHQVRMSWIAPGRLQTTARCMQRADLTRLTQACSAVKPGGSVALSEWMARAITACRMRGGQAILLSDCMHRPADWFGAVHGLLRRHLEVKVIQILSPEELEPSRLMRGTVLVDSETGSTHQLAYSPAELAQAVIDHNETLARFCKRNNVLFVQHRLDEPLERFILKTLPLRGFLE